MYNVISSIISIVFFFALIITVFVWAWKNSWMGKLGVFILLFELLLAFAFSRPSASYYSLFMPFANFLGEYIPSINKLTAIAHYPEGLKIYFSITLCLMLVKFYLFYQWFSKDHDGIAQHAVISPFHRYNTIATGDFIRYGLKRRDKPLSDEEIVARLMARNDKPPSWFKIIFFSVAICGLAIGILFGIYFNLNTLGTHNSRSIVNMTHIIQGNFSMWFGWSLLGSSFFSFLIATAFMTLRDWCLFFINIFLRLFASLLQVITTKGR